MNVNRRVMFLFGLLCLLGARSVVALSPEDGRHFVSIWQEAQDTPDRAVLLKMFDPEARVRIEMEHPDGDDEHPRQVFTLTPERFVQQLHVMWRFADEQHRSIKNIEHVQLASGALRVSFTQTEQRRLFGKQRGQRDRVTLELRRRDGDVRITDLHSISKLW